MFKPKQIVRPESQASSVAQEQPKTPPLEAFPEPVAKKPKLTDTHNYTGGFREDLCDAVVIQVLDEYVLDEKMCVQDLEEIQGIFWLIGHNEGVPVFKQEPSPASNCKELLFWFYKGHGKNGQDQGWYVSDIMWETAKQMVDCRVLAWCKVPQQDKIIPSAVHMPYWSKKPFKFVTILSLHDFNCRELERLNAENRELSAAVLFDTTEEQSSPRVIMPEEATASKGKGKGGKSKQSHGGWCPKAGKLVKAYRKEQWDKCTELCDTYYNESGVIRGIVDGFR